VTALFYGGSMVLLLLANAFCVAAEFSVVASRIHRVPKKHPRANRFLALLSKPLLLDRHVGACQVGISITSLVLGAIMQATITLWIASGFFHWQGGRWSQESFVQGCALLVLSTIQMVVGELAPKALVLRAPERYSLAMLDGSKIMRWFLTPLILPLNGSARLLLKIFHLPHDAKPWVHSPEEIVLMLRDRRKKGRMESAHSHHLERALEVLAWPANRLMVPRPRMVAFEKNISSQILIQNLSQEPYSRFPVYDDSVDHILGLIATKDVLQSLAKDLPISIAEILRPLPTLPEGVSVQRALETLKETGPMLMLADEFGGVAGLLTLEDVAEAILGEMGDEFQEPDPEPVLLQNGWTRVPGDFPLEAMEEWFGIPWEAEADTLAGAVVEALGHVAHEGEEASTHGFEVLVKQTRQNAILTLHIRTIPEKEESP